MMLKRLLPIAVLLGAGVLLFYAGTRAMSWALARPEVQAQPRPMAVVSLTPSAPVPTQPPAATVPPTAARPPTALPTEAAVKVPASPVRASRPTENAEPTFTPIATFTPMPTLTTAPTSLPATAQVLQSTPAAPVAPLVAPTLLEPPANETLKGRVTFKWQPGALPPGAAYEVVWWKKSEDPSASRGLAQPSTSASQSIDLSGLELPTGQALYWSVLVVNVVPYQRLLTPQASNGRSFVLQNSDTGSPSSGGIGAPK